jgi:hypothetical protein
LTVLLGDGLVEVPTDTVKKDGMWMGLPIPPLVFFDFLNQLFKIGY